MGMSIRQERYLWSRIKDYEKRIKNLERFVEGLTAIAGQSTATALACGRLDSKIPTHSPLEEKDSEPCPLSPKGA